MKKQNNISRVINKLLYITLACIIFNACTDEEIISSTKVEAGIPVEVQLGMSISGMSEVSTRSLDEDAESQVNDLYVLVFDANSQQKKTGKFFSTDEIVSTTTNKNKGSIVLKTTSGEYPKSTGSSKHEWSIQNYQSTKQSGRILHHK